MRRLAGNLALFRNLPVPHTPPRPRHRLAEAYRHAAALRQIHTHGGQPQPVDLALGEIAAGNEDAVLATALRLDILQRQHLGGEQHPEFGNESEPSRVGIWAGARSSRTAGSAKASETWRAEYRTIVAFKNFPKEAPDGETQLCVREASARSGKKGQERGKAPAQDGLAGKSGRNGQPGTGRAAAGN